CQIDRIIDPAAIVEEVTVMVSQVQAYVPGYRLTASPVVKENIVEISLEVEGVGDYLPAYAGNLDIMTTSAVVVAERLVRQRLREINHDRDQHYQEVANERRAHDCKLNEPNR